MIEHLLGGFDNEMEKIAYYRVGVPLKTKAAQKQFKQDTVAKSKKTGTVVGGLAGGASGVTAMNIADKLTKRKIQGKGKLALLSGGLIGGGTLLGGLAGRYLGKKSGQKRSEKRIKKGWGFTPAGRSKESVIDKALEYNKLNKGKK